MVSITTSQWGLGFDSQPGQTGLPPGGCARFFRELPLTVSALWWTDWCPIQGVWILNLCPLCPLKSWNRLCYPKLPDTTKLPENNGNKGEIHPWQSASTTHVGQHKSLEGHLAQFPLPSFLRTLGAANSEATCFSLILIICKELFFSHTMEILFNFVWIIAANICEWSEVNCLWERTSVYRNQYK